MDKWKQEYVKLLKAGASREMAARGLSLQLAYVEQELKRDVEFERAVANVYRRSEKKMDAAELELAYQAQCTEEEVAAFFGMSVGGLRAEIAANEELKAAMERGPLAGKAAIRMAQFQQAAGGDKDMLKWAGKQYLGQSERVESTERRELIDVDPERLAAMAIFLGECLKRGQGVTINGDAKEVLAKSLTIEDNSEGAAMEPTEH